MVTRFFQFCVFFLAVLLAPAHALILPSSLVDTDWLGENLQKITVLDVRKDLDSFTKEGHIAGAILVNAKKIRTARMINGIELTRMRPTRSVFEAFMSEHGVSNNSIVVITHQGITPGDVAGAARLYWQMKYYGIDQVAMLDGGNAQWLANMEELTIEPVKIPKGDFKVTTENSDILAVLELVKESINSDQVTLIDTRSLRFHIGLEKRSYVYDYGHIPSSRVFPYKFLHPSKGVMIFPTKQQIKARFDALKINPDGATILYCNSAYECSSVWFSLHEIYGNQDVRIYDGSLHQWTKDYNRPMTTILR
ncbi:Thiosulfate sulfurtransferase, rhodanese [hydrothermal vent metagenome]|uniref:Thiosulfate sulfurtransferase, rhodanese n=1 Tax=hydrothermal vent metagenome TaxID=652676 RepID=A0A1W1D968_9ZZZZ